MAGTPRRSRQRSSPRASIACARRRTPRAGHSRPSRCRSVALRHALTADARKAVVDQLSAYKALGLTHVMLDFRRDSLGEMLEILELVATEIRPAVDRVWGAEAGHRLEGLPLSPP